MASKLDNEIERLETKLKQKKALKAQKDALEKKAATKRERALETRKKILLGAIAMRGMEDNFQLHHHLSAIADQMLKRDDDRALFNLPPLPTNTDKTAIN